MIEKFCSATLDYLKFSFGIMLAVTAILGLVSAMRTHATGVTAALGALALLKIAEEVLERDTGAGLTNVRSASLGLRVFVNLLSLVLPLSAVNWLIVQRSHKRNR